MYCTALLENGFSSAGTHSAQASNDASRIIANPGTIAD